MTSTSHGSHASHSASTLRPLRRGSACLTCRRLYLHKLHQKCDGVRPICGPCVQSPKDDPCEYNNAPGRSRARVLEETVSRLKARLREYEHPEETPSMELHDPYQHSQVHDSGGTIRVNVDRPFSSNSSYGSPSSSYSSPSSSFFGTSTLRDSYSGKLCSFAMYKVIQFIILVSLEWFLNNAGSFGFFLEHSRFSSSALLPLDFGHQSRPCPGLLSTVYLWGIHLSPQTQHKDLEHTLLMRALRDTASDLSTSNLHPHRFMHTIQAETLLGYYFFRNGNILEAKRHASSAAALALGCGLNTLRSSHEQQHWSSNINLPPPQDAIEEGERINAFWATFTLYRDIAVTVDPPRSLCGMFDTPGCQIDTPWPLDMDMYKKNILPRRSSMTIHEFVNHIQQSDDQNQLTSATNVITKASLLLHQASFVAGQYDSNMRTPEAQTLFAAFQSVRQLISSLQSQLSPLQEFDYRNQNLSALREIHLAHSLVHGSIIRLNEIFFDSDADCRQYCVKSAHAMIHGGGFDVAEFGCVNPIIGTLWTLACQTLVQEIVRLRAMRTEAQGSWPSRSSEPASISPFSYRQDHVHVASESENTGDLHLNGEDRLSASLQRGLSALTFFSANSALMDKSFLSSPLFNVR
ncbi:hypothetical protein F5876DRAFT_48776 [Lentinula aff. lateritia]|uniref:Uncharacterized protein n=1 Tax=Lentinula aff. lateritia TaxID=2804960 RepID=A0ACC1TQR9_9AGAR|nr:hypothetical protein F5876DRAFT_48776 [Lentinula aff. lateritia]